MSTDDNRRKPNACRSCGGTGRIKARHAMDYPDGCGACGGSGELTIPPRYEMTRAIRDKIGRASTQNLRAICEILKDIPLEDDGPFIVFGTEPPPATAALLPPARPKPAS